MNETQERNPPTIDEVVIAALLHNIDTVAQRAGDQPQALFTEYAGCFPKEIDPQLVGALAARHGSPIITEAARVASGVEGISNDDEEASAAEPLRPLQAIWPGIGENRFYCLATLEPEHTIPDKATVTIADYENVWQGFLSNFRQFDSMSLSPAEFIAALNALLEHWLWAVPYSTTDGCDVSLYDHSICTAACAAALYRYHEAEGALDDAEAIRNHTAQRFRFVVGDVSGIQRHIFDLKSDDRAAKLLRARSFALQLCSRDITRWIVRKLNLPPQSILYDAGGRFLLVVPNIDTAGQQLEEIADRVERWCLDHYLGEVSFSIAFCVTACTEDLTQERFGAFMRRIGAAATEAKQQKLQRALLPEASEAPEDPHVLNLKVDQQLGICQLCDKHPATKVSDDADLCEQCARLVQLGKSIPKARYLAFVDEEGARGIAPILLPSNKVARLFTSDEPPPSSRADCYALNRFEAGLPTWRLPFHLPTHDDGTDTQPPVTTFDKISEMDGTDFPRLAMLKADVDRLGWLFEGVSRGAKGSLSRYMGMSRMLDYYFSARLQQIIKRDACYDEAIYTVFAGGDDLCLIGPWQRILRLAGEVRRDFAGFVGGSGDVTFSAGVALVHQKAPVRTLAHSADENLEQAKEGGRDSITLFGITTPWGDVRLSPECLSKRAPSVESTPENQHLLGYHGLIEFGKTLYCLIKHEKLSYGSVYRLLDFSRRDRKIKRNGSVVHRDLLWRSHLHYMLARNFRQNDSDDEEKRKERECLLSEIVTNIDRLPVAVHWALYRHRSEGEE